MNFLAHYHLNHAIRGLPNDRAFVVGVALPDFWTRFSRSHRIHWRTVRGVAPRNPDEAALRDGLLNHAAADAAFHALPLFARWQREIRERVPPHGVHDAVERFVAHVGVELALDRALLSRDAALADRFYADFAACDPAWVGDAVAHVGGVQAPGLIEALRSFCQRAYLREYRHPLALRTVLERLLATVGVDAPPTAWLDARVAAAIDVVREEELWPLLSE
ncbi:MAG: hypothetical protein HRU75_12760 [Planctomycetia bacterium]|nr:MAG: hypothetical protein HRU75_12760 [Planctomycetia bacterium]